MRFSFKLVPFIVTVAVVAAGLALGNWQRHRAEATGLVRDASVILTRSLAASSDAAGLHESAGQPAQAAPPPVEFRRVRVSGQFVRDWPVYLDNRPHQGRAGFYLLMPFAIAGSNMHVLVARGWLPRDPQQRDKLPAVATPRGTVTLEGSARLSAGHVMQLGSAPALKAGAIVQNADPAQVAAASGLAMQPFLIEQGGAAVPGDEPQLVRDWPAPELGVDKHRGYAFQWYALAAMAVLFFVFTGLRKSGKR